MEAPKLLPPVLIPRQSAVGCGTMTSQCRLGSGGQLAGDLSLQPPLPLDLQAGQTQNGVASDETKLIDFSNHRFFGFMC